LQGSSDEQQRQECTPVATIMSTSATTTTESSSGGGDNGGSDVRAFAAEVVAALCAEDAPVPEGGWSPPGGDGLVVGSAHAAALWRVRDELVNFVPPPATPPSPPAEGSSNSNHNSSASRTTNDVRFALVEAGIVPAIVDATNRPRDMYANFFHLAFSVLGCLVGFPGDEDDDDDDGYFDCDVAKAVVAQGGVACMIDFLQRPRGDRGDGGMDDLWNTKTCFIAFHNLFRSVNDDLEALKELAKAALPVTIRQMERLAVRIPGTAAAEGGDNAISDSDLYTVGCLVLSSCRFVPNDLFERIVQVIYSGVVIHSDDDEAQDLGKALLVGLVGRETAISLIVHAECHHAEGCECSGAA